MHGADQLRMLTEQGKGAGDEGGDGLWEHKEALVPVVPAVDKEWLGAGIQPFPRSRVTQTCSANRRLLTCSSPLFGPGHTSSHTFLF